MARQSKKQKENESNVQELLDAIIAGIQEKKGKVIRLLDLTGLKNASADYFIICHGDSQRQTAAIADSVEDEVRKRTGEKPWHVEGTQNAQWVLIDYVNVVVHIFYVEAREFYNIESLWADARVKEISEEIISVPAIKKKAKTSTKKKAPLKTVKKAVKSKAAKTKKK